MKTIARWSRIPPMLAAVSVVLALTAVPSTAATAVRATPPRPTTSGPGPVAPPHRVSGGHTGAPAPIHPSPTPAPPTVSPGSSGTTGGAGPEATTQSTPVLQIAQSRCTAGTSSAGAIQAAFNQRGPIWGGGDGAQPVPIDGGRTVWLFGDTYIGGGPYGGPLSTSGIVHNSMVVQYNGSCFAYLLGDADYAWQSAIPQPSSTDWYWPDDGTYDSATGILSIVATHVRVTTGGQWGWTELGVDVLHYQVEPSFTLVSTQTLFSYGSGDVAQFGQSILVDGGVTYLYACAQSGTPACYLARTDLELDAATLQFHTASGWSSSMGAAAPLAISGLTGTELHVTPSGGGYLATNQVPVLSTTASGWWSPSLFGPFVAVGPIFDEAAPPLGPIPSNWFTYGGRLIRTSAGTIGVYSVNTWDAQASEVAGVYGPRFVALDPSTLTRSPFGGMNQPTAAPGAAEIRGWAIDPDTTAPISVRISVDGVTSTSVTASVSRPDVAAFHPSYGSLHGFDTVVGLSPGVHQVCATGINVVAGVADSSLGCVAAGGFGPAGTFTPVVPTRLLDSRNGTGGYAAPWGPDTVRSLRVAGVGPVPASATAVVVNLTVTDPTAPGFVTATPSGGIVPTASNVNFVAGQTIANLVTVQVGAGGSIDLYNGFGRVDLVADVVGYYTTGSGQGFTATNPTRLLDSRNGTGGYASPWGQDQARSLTVAGVGPVPTNATAVVLNLTVTDPTVSSYVTAWPAGGGLPTASNLNFVAGQTIANLVTVQVGAGGAINLFNLFGSTDLVADVVGYYSPSGGSPLVPMAPTRLLDSRNGTGGYASPWGRNQTRNLVIGGVDGIPTNATAVVLNLTVTDPTVSSYVTAWPAGGWVPTASNLNFVAGQTIANLVTVRLGPGGVISLFNLFGSTDLVADVVGYFPA